MSAYPEGVLTLCIDTSAGTAVALVAGAVLAAEQSPDPRRHAETLAPMIEQVLDRSGARREDIDAVVVGTGPGPFTGLRVGLVTARTVARTLGVPVHGAGSLDALARQALDHTEHPEVVVVTDARRKEVYWARYRARGPHDVELLAGPEVAAPAALGEQLAAERDVALVGAGTALYPEQLPATPGLPGHPDAAVLARLVRARLAGTGAGLGTDPQYLRRPDVQAPGTPKRASHRA